MAFTGQKIPTGYARQLAKNYQTHKLGGRLLQEDTKAAWFPAKVILEALGLPLGTHTGIISGLRIYFGAYEDRTDFPRKPDYKNMMTLILVQTTASSETDAEGFPVHKDILDEPHAQPEYPSSPAAFNDSQICPPPRCSNFGLLNF